MKIVNMKMRNSFIKIPLLILLFVIGCRPLADVQRSKPEKPEVEVPTEVTVTDTDVLLEDKPKQTDMPPMTDTLSLCGNSSFDLQENINQSVILLAGTPYNPFENTDCSGIFHKVIDGMRDKCPNAIFPSILAARTTRSIAAWYDDNGQLTIIRDPKAHSDLIKPGMVMFYGYQKRIPPYDYKTMTIDTLKTPKIGINHIAIVTRVSRDVNNIVESYTIFHGRSPGKDAAETVCYRKVRSHPKLPVYGNWGEPWLAIAEVMAPKR